MSIKFIDLKKGDKLKTTQMGVKVTSFLLESPKQGKGLKNVVLVDTKGSEIGMFDEWGSVYSQDVVSVYRDEMWHDVTDQPENVSGYSYFD